jgi:hypothetical protein
MDDVSIRLQDTGLQPFPDQVEQGPVLDAQAQHVQQPGMVNVVEEAFDIYLDQIPLPPGLQVEGEVPDRLQRPAFGPIAVTTL